MFLASSKRAVAVAAVSMTTTAIALWPRSCAQSFSAQPGGVEPFQRTCFFSRTPSQQLCPSWYAAAAAAPSEVEVGGLPAPFLASTLDVSGAAKPGDARQQPAAASSSQEQQPKEEVSAVVKEYNVSELSQRERDKLLDEFRSCETRKLEALANRKVQFLIRSLAHHGCILDDPVHFVQVRVFGLLRAYACVRESAHASDRMGARTFALSLARFHTFRRGCGTTSSHYLSSL